MCYVMTDYAELKVAVNMWTSWLLLAHGCDQRLGEFGGKRAWDGPPRNVPGLSLR